MSHVGVIEPEGPLLVVEVVEEDSQVVAHVIGERTWPPSGGSGTRSSRSSGPGNGSCSSSQVSRS